ncbi:MAG: hypothetical protein QOJ64_2517 [Acidobacteriota bacterium]|jgi:hypothetical protein|nr:hypothetical protein [Acidobacteriota bacterium]
MKKVIALVSFMVFAIACSSEPTANKAPATNANKAAETKPAGSIPAEAEMTAMEKAAWETLKKKDFDAFGNMLAPEYIEVGDDGVYDKAGIIANLKDLEITDVSFADWKMIPIDNDAVILTYNTTIKAKYKGEPVPPGPYHSAAAWVNRGGKWLGFYYQQTLAKEMPAPPPAAAAKAEKSAPPPAAKPAEAGADPIADEKIVWEFIKAKNSDAFGAMLAPEFVEIEAYAVYDKAGAVKSITEFDGSKFELSEWKAAKLDNDASLVTYLVKPGDPKMDSERHTTMWANRGGKWLAVLHMGTPVAKPAAKAEPKK